MKNTGYIKQIYGKELNFRGFPGISVSTADSTFLSCILYTKINGAAERFQHTVSSSDNNDGSLF